jgi:serine/threonine-protein kinase
MAKVYRATAGDGTCVALKVIRSSLAFDEDFRRRFRREAKIALTVRHPHLVPVLDVGEHQGLPYIVTQFIDGISLAERFRRDGALDLPTTVRICSEVADGLDALWAAGIVHRDVKPANILLDRRETAYLADFGVAKDYHGSLITRPGQPLGSIDYMAPEQIRGEPVTGAADLYSLACVSFECIQGKPPFADRRLVHVLTGHLHDDPPDPGDRRPDISRAFTEALMTALSKHPQERQRSCTAFARSLATAIGAASPVSNLDPFG